MRNAVLKLGLFGFMIFTFDFLMGQDTQFSQFYNNCLYYNPAFAGYNQDMGGSDLGRGKLYQDLRISSSYKNLWSKIPGISTYNLSIDYYLSKLRSGFGFLILNNNESYFPYRTSRMEFGFSHRLLIDKDKDQMIQLGMSVSLNINNFQIDRLTFTNQLNSYNNNKARSTYVVDIADHVNYQDWNFGVVYRGNITQIKMIPTIGLSVSHLTRPNISMVNGTERLPVKYVVTANILTDLRFGKTKKRDLRSFLSPGFIYEHQGKSQSFTIGTGYELDPLRLGIWVRNRNFYSENIYKINSIIFRAGFILPISKKIKIVTNNLIIDYSYDSTVSKLGFNTGGVHEITLTCNFPQKECNNDGPRVKKSLR